MVDYEQHIISVVLSHCTYSLKLGEAHNVQYDHKALEKHILDKFIRGKPIILADNLQVVYRTDVYTTLTFEAVRKKVTPQVKKVLLHCSKMGILYSGTLLTWNTYTLPLTEL